MQVKKKKEVGGPLKAEQVDDDDKKAHCVQSFDKTEDEAKMLAHQFVDNKVTEVCEEQLSNADDRIAVVQKSISEFHASVAKVLWDQTDSAFCFRHSNANSAAVTKLLKIAINRLNNFFFPELDKPAQKADRVQLLQADRVTEPYTSKLEKNEQGLKTSLRSLGLVEEDHLQILRGVYVGVLPESR